MSRHLYYRLDGHTPVPCEPDQVQFDESTRRVGFTKISDDIYVSTVFLALDHNYDPDGPPLLFETMIFGGPHNDYQERYYTWEEAEAGHEKAVQMASEELA